MSQLPDFQRATAQALRDYQRAAVQAAARMLLEKRRALVMLPTGTGKTRTFARICADVVAGGGRVLVMAHRDELLNQAAATLRAYGLRVEVEQGPRTASAAAQVVVGSVATMRGKRKEKWARDHFDLIVIDEAHRGAAPSYRTVIDYFTTARVLGVTATPYRSDGKGLGAVFGELAYRYEMRQAIADGWLVPLKPHKITVSEVDLDGIAVRGGDFVAGQLDEAFGNDHALHAVARPLLEMAGARQAIVFAAGVAHAAELARVLNGYRPDVAVALSGQSCKELRASELERFRRGERQMLINVGLFTEGTDLPMCSCVAVVRPTRSKRLYTQMIGRGARLAEGAANIAESIELGKADCMVLDFVGVTTRHRLATTVAAMADDDIDPDVLADAETMVDQGLEVDQALELAADLVAKRRDREAREARVRYFAEEIDPFLGTVAPKVGRWAGDPASKGQLAILADHGLKPTIPLTKGDASAIIDKIGARRADGLCSLKQARRLRSMGINAAEMSREDADELFAIWREAGKEEGGKGWRMTPSELQRAAAQLESERGRNVA